MSRTLYTRSFLDFDVYPRMQKNVMSADEQAVSQGLVLVVRGALSDENRQLLEKIMQATGRDLSKDCLLLTSEEAPHFATLYRNYGMKRLVLFGWQPADLGLHLRLPKYTICTWMGVEVLSSDMLEALGQDSRKKGLLWKALQELFRL